jgi:hypothetical protein
MNPKQFAAIALVAFSFTASMPIALAQDEHAQHEDDHPETSPGLVRDVPSHHPKIAGRECGNGGGLRFSGKLRERPERGLDGRALRQ